MKLTKFFALLFAFSAMTFTFTACGDDEEDINNLEELINGKVEPRFTKETPTELEITLSDEDVVEVINARFDEKTGMVTKVIAKATYASEKLAKIAYEEIKAEGDDAELNGRTITMDVTDQFEGRTYGEVYAIFKIMIEIAKNGEPQ
ncbi:MAG: hypothetical protein MJZ54_01660 [Bacteroidaceae bacterium]|nr:hypothetical protein [Bacteroidaceae bacterium]